MIDRRNFVRLALGSLAASVAASRADAARPGALHVVMIDAKTSRFVPELLTISVGDVVEWRNSGYIMHSVDFDPALAKEPKNVSLPQGVAPFSSGMMDEETSYRHQFNTAGDYKYICKYHESMGMHGGIRVIG